MPEETLTAPTVANRPAFLSLLCILVCLGSIGGIVQNAAGIFKAEEKVAEITSGTDKTQLKNLFHFSDANQGPISVPNLTPENYQKFSIGGVVASLLCLVGGVLMWKQLKSGFYSFTLGTFFNILTHFLLFGDRIGIMGLSILAAIAGLGLVVLLGTQLKYMYGND